MMIRELNLDLINYSIERLIEELKVYACYLALVNSFINSYSDIFLSVGFSEEYSMISSLK